MFGVLVAALLSACTGGEAPAPEMTNEERGQIQAEVLGWSDQFLSNVNNVDAQGVADLFDSSDAHFIEGATYHPSWQAFLTGTRELYSGWEGWQGEWVTRRVDVLDFDAALLVGEVTSVLTLQDGTEYDNRALFSFVVRRGEDGAWSGLFGHVSGARTVRD
jgi:hypothetical protein